MKKMSQEELDQVLQQHELWVESGGVQGARADLSRINLSHAHLSGAQLSYADLSCAQLAGANLTCADLSGAQLSGAWLYEADLSGADLSHVDLTGAWLFHANLTGAQISAATRLHQCLNFKHLTCSPDTLPWLILHPKWAQWKSTVKVIKDNQE